MDASPGARPGGNAGNAGSYEIVSVTRPESVDTYHALYKAAYDMCATHRAAMKLPPAAPMKQPPPDFVEERNTFVSDGKAFLEKKEGFRMDLDGNPETGCRTRLLASTSYSLYRDGKQTSVGISEEGRSEDSGEWFLPGQYTFDEAAKYTEKKTIHGVAVRCQTPTGTGLDNIVQNLCIADGSPRPPTDANGNPIQVSSRVKNVVLKDVVMITEPVSAKFGARIDPKAFDLPGKK